MSGYKPQVVADTVCGRGFWKLVYVLMTRPGKKIRTTEFLYMRAFKTNLFNCEADPLTQSLVSCW